MRKKLKAAVFLMWCIVCALFVILLVAGISQWVGIMPKMLVASIAFVILILFIVFSD